MKSFRGLVVLAVVCLAALFASSFAVPLPSKPVTNLAFGSCNAHTRDQQIWKGIADANPDIFVWLGDVVYADTPLFPMIAKSTPIPQMRAKFDAQKSSPLYSQLREKTPIVGVWDDHDFGKNNGGAEYHDRVPSQQVFLDFVDEPTDSPRRNRTGVYTSYLLPGSHGKDDINLILLDVRYHKHGSMGGGDILGDDQWAWLEKLLAESKSRFHIFGSGIQVTPFQKPVQEAWSLYPHSRQRLFDLLGRLRVPGAILLSGDVHYSEVLKVPTECSSTGYPVYEFTSSGLTHTCDGLLGNCKWFLDRFFMTPYHHGDSFYTQKNWGGLRFDWHKETLTLETHGLEGQVVHSTVIPFAEIASPNPAAFNPKRHIGSLTKCDGPLNWFLLMPFEDWKYSLFLIPIAMLVVIFLVIKKLVKMIFCSSKQDKKKTE